MAGHPALALAPAAIVLVWQLWRRRARADERDTFTKPVVKQRQTPQQPAAADPQFRFPTPTAINGCAHAHMALVSPPPPAPPPPPPPSPSGWIGRLVINLFALLLLGAAAAACVLRGVPEAAAAVGLGALMLCFSQVSEQLPLASQLPPGAPAAAPDRPPVAHLTVGTSL